MNLFNFLFNSLLLGAGLAMDAVSVSAANALREPEMEARRRCAVAGVYGGFQALMPMTGWFLVRTAAERFAAFQRWIPWIGAGLLFWVGARMVREGPREQEEAAPPCLGAGDLLVQGVATSIDALSVGFAVASYRAGEALAAACIIGAVTFALCLAALAVGNRAGARLADRAPLAGGIILMLIGAEMLLRGLS